MKPEELLDIVEIVDSMDLPDGAHFAMIEEMTGMDAITVYSEIEYLVDDAEEE